MGVSATSFEAGPTHGGAMNFHLGVSLENGSLGSIGQAPTSVYKHFYRLWLQKWSKF